MHSGNVMARDDHTPMTLIGDRLATRFPISDAALDAIAAVPHETKVFEPSSYLLRNGERPAHATFVLSGHIYRQKIAAGGARQIVAVHMAGDFVDLQHLMLAHADHNIQALTRATVAQIASDALVELAFAHPDIGRALWTESLIEAAIFREWVVNIGRRDARARTAHLLCELAVRQEAAGLGDRSSLDLPMSQEQLGDALGLTSVHVNRTLRKLERDELIERSKRSVTVRDWSGLKRTGDFHPRYLHIEDTK